MGEVFSSQPALSDQPISHPSLNISQIATALSRMAHILLDRQTLNMSSLPFMSMEPYIKKGGSLTREEKVLNMDEKFWNYEKLYGPLSE
jgi:hypothetical protein